MKTVCPKGRVGSNPTLSVSKTVINFIRYENQPAEVPKRLKGLPWKGSRSLVAARGFKSLLLRYFLNEKVHIENSGRKIKKFLTEGCGCDNLLKLTCEEETLPEQTAK